MKMLIGLTTLLIVALAAVADSRATDGKIGLVAAENFYADVARQIGGDQVSASSIMSNPDQDPHLFEVSAGVVRQIAGAQIVIYNGADYDPWMDKLLKATSKPGRVVIVAADLMHKRAGDNPHLWYDPTTMPVVAGALAAALAAADPTHRDAYAARLKTFLASLEPLNQKIAAIRGRFANAPVSASEPIFGYMAAALKLQMRNDRFQLSIMNDTEPSARDVAAFEQDLKTHSVRIMLYNKQALNRVVQHLVDLARACNVPVVGLTETVPPGLSFQDWMMTQLEDTEKALAGPSS